MTIKSLKSEIVVVGAGVIGLSVALELRLRGHDVTVVDTRRAMQQASLAAAGMLAVDDPHNPAALLPLSRLSASLYPNYLQRVEKLSGVSVPFQTDTVVEYLPDGQVMRRPERSLDPRQLAMALLGAAHHSGIPLHEDVGALEFSADNEAAHVTTSLGHKFKANQFVHTTGAWFQRCEKVTPLKGQMLRVQMPMGRTITEVHRRGDIYLVPRSQGPRAGTVLIGATIEDVGFDVTTRQADLDRLRSLAGELLPPFGDEAETPVIEAWAGLRPATPDGLPLIGTLEGGSQQFVATGHFRNGILLAPATATVLADKVEGKAGRIDLSAFWPERFS